MDWQLENLKGRWENEKVRRERERERERESREFMTC